MVSFYKSKEGIEAYQKLGLPYPVTVNDAIYDRYREKTKHSPDDLNFTMIHNLRRVLVGEEQEFLVHDLFELRCDFVGNEKHFYRSNMGMYQIPIPRYEMRENADGYKEKKIVGTAGIRTGYSIPFTKENVEQFVKKGWIVLDDNAKERSKQNIKRLEAAAREKAAVRDIITMGATHFSVGSEGDRRHFTVLSYKDFLEGLWQELRHFGRSNVSKDDWARWKAVNEVAAAAKEQGQQHVLEDINSAINRNRTEEELYK